MGAERLIMPVLATAISVSGCAGKKDAALENAVDVRNVATASVASPAPSNKINGLLADRSCNVQAGDSPYPYIRGMYVDPDLQTANPGLCEKIADTNTSPDEVITAVRQAQFNLSWANQRGIDGAPDVVPGIVFAARTSEVVKKQASELDIDDPSLMGAAVSGSYMADIVPMDTPLNPALPNDQKHEFFFIASVPPSGPGDLDGRVVIPDYGDKVEAGDWYELGRMQVEASWNNVAWRHAPAVLSGWRVKLAEDQGEDNLYIAVVKPCEGENLECEGVSEPRAMWDVHIPIERSPLDSADREEK